MPRNEFRVTSISWKQELSVDATPDDLYSPWHGSMLEKANGIVVLGKRGFFRALFYTLCRYASELSVHRDPYDLRPS